MKTITITLPEPLDERTAAEAKRRGISKSALIREGLKSVLPEQADNDTNDLWTELSGFGDEGVTADPGEIDRVVYDQ